MECSQGQPFLLTTLWVMKDPREGWPGSDDETCHGQDRKEAPSTESHQGTSYSLLLSILVCSSKHKPGLQRQLWQNSCYPFSCFLSLWSLHTQVDSSLGITPFQDCSCLVWSSEVKDAGKQFKVSLMDGNALSLPFKVSAQPLWANS